MERKIFLMGEKKISKFYIKFERTSRRNQRIFSLKKELIKFSQELKEFF